MLRLIGVVASTMSLLMPNPVLADDTLEPVILSPAGPWQLDMATNKCRLARLFDSGEQKTVFYLEQWNPGSDLLMTVAGPPFAKFRYFRDTQYTFGEAGDAGEFGFTKSTLGEYGAAINTSTTIARQEDADDDAEARDYSDRPRGLPTIDSEGAAGIETLTFYQKKRAPVMLKLGDMQAPLAAMNMCMRDLVKDWGFDPDEQATVQTPARVTNMEHVVRRVQDAYPTDALRRGAQADFHMRLTVGADGKVEDCVLLNQTHAEGFDIRKGPYHNFMTNAEFEPARDAAGTPIRTYYTSRIVYRIG